MRTVAMKAPKPPAPKTVIRPAVPQKGVEESFAGQLAAFTVAMSKQPDTLLAMLVDELAPTAQQVALTLKKGTSAERQAALARNFGLRPDAQRRLRAVVAEAGPVLRREIFRAAPLWMRSWLTELTSLPEGTPAAPPLVTALAERLLREATR